AKQKKNNRKGKDKAREERSSVAVHDKQQDNAADEKKDSNMEEVQTLDEKLDALEVVSDVSDSVDGVGEVLQPDSEDRDVSPVNWDTDASEVHPPTDASSNGIGVHSSIQNGMAEKRSGSMIDDSSSTCSTDSLPSVVMNDPYKGNSFSSYKVQKSPSRGKNRVKASSDGSNWTSEMDSQASGSAADTVGINNESASGKEEEVLSLQKKQSIKDQVDIESLQKEKTSAVPSSPRSPSRNLPTSVQTKSEHQTSGTVEPVHVRRSSFSVSQQTDKDASSLTAASQATILPRKEIQKTSPPRLTEKSTAQVAMMSRPSSAPLVPGGPRPTASVVSMVQTAPLLARSVSATGRLGPDPSPATHSYAPQSYRNAIMGNHVASTAASLAHSNSSSGVNPSPGYSQPPLVSLPIFLPQGSDKMDSKAVQSGVPFGILTRDVLQNGPQWIESSQREASRSMHYDPSARLNDVQNLDLYTPVDGRSLDNIPSEFPACSSRRPNQGLLVDEFPHLDIINDLLDEEHVIGKAARTSSVFQPLNDGPQLLSRQFTFPGDLVTNDDLGSSTSSCRFERSRSYHDPGYHQGYSSSGGHFDSLRDYHPQASSLSYGNGKVDGLVPNQWQVAGSDLSYLGMRNTDNDGYSYYQDYSNLACGVNGYTMFRPSNGFVYLVIVWVLLLVYVMELDASHIGHESSVEGVEVQLEPEGDAGLRTARKTLIGGVAFWVQLHGLPLELMTTHNAAKVAELLGEVLINVKNPLTTGFWLPRKDLPRTWILVKYERLQGFCFHCGVLGYDARKCNKEQLMAIHIPNKPRYNAGLGVPPAKSLAAIAAENAFRRRKMKEGVALMVSGGQSEFVGPEIAQNLSGMLVEEPLADVDPQNPTTSLGGHQVANNDSVCVNTALHGGVGEAQLRDSNSSKSQENDMQGSGNALSLGPMCKIKGQGPMQDGLFGKTSSHVNGPEYVDISGGGPTVISKGPLIEASLRDLEGGVRRPGLGHERLDDIGVHKEFIGLSEEKLIIDYPSPKIKDSSSFGVHLTNDEITRCRKSWLFTEGIKAAQQKTVGGREVVDNRAAPNYYVEFPPEEDEVPTTRFTSLIVSSVHSLVQGGPIHAPTSTMIILSWNCRGVGASATANELKELCKSSKPAIVFLMETRAKLEKLGEVQRRLRFSKCFCVNPQGQSGGLGLFWDNSVECTFIYGDPTPRPRRELWGQLSLLTTGRVHPWALVGDLIRSFVEDYGLIDMEMKGNRFTWFNHSPVLFEVCPKDGSGTSFRYELMWDEHPERKEVVTKGWSEGLGCEDNWDRFFKRQEEAYWGQRSRLKWIKWGDRNTKFFHATTVQQRWRNRIVRIKDDQGSWVTGHKLVMKAAMDHFQKVYTSESISGLDDCLQAIPSLVSTDLNQRLCREVNDDEIKRAVEGLGKLKAPGPDGLNG
ncbi:Zinc knuckle CX2CX4HX4C, partial [Sesbania bispinosa]